MNLVLVSINNELESAWKYHLGDLPGVSFHRGHIMDVECDAVVSPANSFGFMDGGIDAVYLDNFGIHLEKRVQERIRTKFNGELLVGQATTVATESEKIHKIPWLIVAPTMRVPMRLPADTVNPYLAARAVFIEVSNYTSLDPDKVTVAMPGLGTATGGVPAEICGHQVATAWRDVFDPTPNQQADPFYQACLRHRLLWDPDFRRAGT